MTNITEHVTYHVFIRFLFLLLLLLFCWCLSGRSGTAGAGSGSTHRRSTASCTNIGKEFLYILSLKGLGKEAGPYRLKVNASCVGNG